MIAPSSSLHFLGERKVVIVVPPLLCVVSLPSQKLQRCAAPMYWHFSGESTVSPCASELLGRFAVTS
jgi:hypothetical protein